MNKAIDILLNSDELATIGSIPGIKKTSVSPLNLSTDSVNSEKSVKSLKEKGVIAAHGGISGEYTEAVDLLAECRTYTRIRFTNGPDIFEFLLCFSHDGEDTVSLTTTNEGLQIESPADITGMFEAVKQFTGDNLLVNCSFNYVTDHITALVMAALIDNYRKGLLKSFSGESDFEKGSYTSGDVLDMLKNTTEYPQWIAFIIKSLSGDDLEVSEENVEKSLKALEAQGYAEESSSRYSIAGALEHVANRILIIDNIISLSIGKEDSESNVTVAGFTCLQSGVNDLLFLDESDDGISFNMVSSGELLDYVSHFLSESDPMKDVLPSERKIKQDTPDTDTEEFKCINCGKPLSEGARFCQSCGTPVKEEKATEEKVQKKFCVKCGREIKTDSRFCTSCGTPVA